MDASHRSYHRIVGEMAREVIDRFDCSTPRPSILDQLQIELIRLQDTPLLGIREACGLILRVSDSPVAQSYRNTRYTNPGAELNVQRWAGLTLASDVRERVLQILQVRDLNQPDLRMWISAWQERESLRAEFSADTPWCIVADWYEELGESMKASVCRRYAAASE